MSGNVNIGNGEEYDPRCLYCNKLIPGAHCDRGKKWKNHSGLP